MLTLPLLVLYGLGTIIGAGIYTLIGAAAGRAGLATPLAFLLAAVLVSFTALSYAELAGRLPRAAGEAAYVERGLQRRPLSVAVGLLVAAVGMVSAATLANGFAGYLRELLPLPRPAGIVLLVAVMAGLAAWGIRESALAAAAVTAIEIGRLLVVAWTGRDALVALPAHLPEMLPAGGAWSGVLAAVYLAFFAFLGFEDMVTVAEEVKDAPRALPAGIVLALVVTLVLYGLVAATAVLAVPPTELAASEAPLALVFSRAGGGPAAAMATVGALSILNGVLIQIIKSSRVLYGMAAQGWLPASLGAVHPRTRTPLAATAAVATAVLGLGLAFPLEALAEATAFAALLVFVLVNAALLALKRREPAPTGVRTVPMVVPGIGLAISLGFAVAEAVMVAGRLF